jgi:hypothetical protein
MLDIIAMLVLGVWGLTYIVQRYLELRLICDFLMLLGSAIIFIGMATVAVFEHFGYYFTDWIECIAITPGLILMFVGFYYAPLNYAIDDITAGNIPLPESYKYKPSLRRKIGMLIGFMGTTGGIIKCYKTYPHISHSGIALIVFGLLIFLISRMDLKGRRERVKYRNRRG